jgi:hypothetical protein
VARWQCTHDCSKFSGIRDGARKGMTVEASVGARGGIQRFGYHRKGAGRGAHRGGINGGAAALVFAREGSSAGLL